MAGVKKTFTEKDYLNFIQKAKEIHKDRYLYYPSFPYSGVDGPMKIICRIHGEFETTAYRHTLGNHCYECSKISRGRKHRGTLADFIKKAKETHGDRYDYSAISWAQSFETKRVTIICSIHGPFSQRKKDHWQRGAGCPDCAFSKDEDAIARWLTTNNIRYETQKVYTGCVCPETGNNLRYDFFVPELNTLIEYDGRQHYEVIDAFKMTQATLYSNMERDEAKTKFAHDNQIGLIRIPFYCHGNISDILSKRLAKLLRD